MMLFTQTSIDFVSFLLTGLSLLDNFISNLTGACIERTKDLT